MSLKYFTHNVVCITFAITSVISIAISAWQFQSNDGGASWVSGDDASSSVDWVNDVCDAWPYQYLRPFAVDCPTCAGGRSYCGYSTSNTGFRLAVAIATIIFAVTLFLKLYDEMPLVQYALLLVTAVLWGATMVADSAALTNATLACNNNDAFLTDMDCYNSKYGISIAIDVGMTVITTLAWLALSAFQGNKDGSAVANARYSASSNSRNSTTIMANPTATTESDLSWK